VVAASDDKLRADLIAECGPGLGEFVADSVEVALRNCPDRVTAEASFLLALHSAFPGANWPMHKAREAFAALRDLAEARRGAMLTRNAILELFERTLGAPPVTDKRLRLNVRSDNSPEAPDALEIDATEFSGITGNYPAAPSWRTGLVTPLEITARWARNQGYGRVALTGSYRLSTALALGWSFRSVVGFELDVPTKSGPWATDDHPSAGEAPPWQVLAPKRLLGDRLVVAIGVLRNPAPDVIGSLPATDDQVLCATLPQALASAVEAQVSARVVKAAVADAVGRLRPAAIDLFYVGPAAFGVVLGHRWNGLPPTQVWEFLRHDGRYTRTAVLA
jgi:hypothetical protein